ncbi:TonB family protein [Permianibacter aggregans]|uniref:Outer membrane transport energization protein TonB n=1 Tax=Permianibacter aggregans TaxID=1510150 RepID=A0A4R6UQ65_9GAMM|nr:energy transducer TonB [Permianibacter aggregans]QGX40027.1 energy transducer TonB [Permianibacter aggregans]TDQ49161.1 outer membrane transport energization protein TonB [Permianibacter aggregans]
MSVTPAEIVLNSDSAPGSADRMTFTMFLSGCLHALLLFGIGFVGEEFLKPKAPLSLDVVLAQHFSKERPKDADFLAQANQKGGGESEKAKPPRSSAQAEMPAPVPQAVAMPVEGGRVAQAARQRIVDAQNAKDKTEKSDPQDETKPEQQNLQTATMVARSLQIASLTAELAAQDEMEAKKPRTRLVAPSTASASDAVYLDAWRRQVERIGNLNYPEEAKRRALFGQLVMRVDINPNGTVREVKILESSGSKLLDDAALRIVRLASPFPPLPPEIRKTTDILQIVRQWRFEPEHGFSSR